MLADTMIVWGYNKEWFQSKIDSISDYNAENKLISMTLFVITGRGSLGSYTFNAITPAFSWFLIVTCLIQFLEELYTILKKLHPFHFTLLVFLWVVWEAHILDK